jgi:U3 small nucleolar RNA-associated protein 19
MRLVKTRADNLPGSETQVWLTGLFKGVFEALLEAWEEESLQSEFVDKFLKEYEDIRYYSFVQIAYASQPREYQTFFMC